MAIISSFQMIDPKHMAESLHAVREKLDSIEGETILDFSSVRRIDAKTLGVMEELAGVADNRAVRIALRGTNVGVYKVLKLVKLAPRFVFLT